MRELVYIFFIHIFFPTFQAMRESTKSCHFFTEEICKWVSIHFQKKKYIENQKILSACTLLYQTRPPYSETLHLSWLSHIDIMVKWAYCIFRREMLHSMDFFFLGGETFWSSISKKWMCRHVCTVLYAYNDSMSEKLSWTYSSISSVVTSTSS